MINMFSVHHVPAGKQIEIPLHVIGEMRPVRAYIKADGANETNPETGEVQDGPSICFVHQHRSIMMTDDVFTIAQISAQMFRPLYEELKKVYKDDRFEEAVALLKEVQMYMSPDKGDSLTLSNIENKLKEWGHGPS